MDALDVLCIVSAGVAFVIWAAMCYEMFVLDGTKGE